MSIRNTRELEWIARGLLFVQDFLQTFRVQVFRIARPVESEAESAVADPIAVHCVVHAIIVHAITVRVVCDLASHVVERLPQWNTITI